VIILGSYVARVLGPVAHDSLVARIPGLKEVFMGSKIYVGNLPFSATSEQLNEMFSKFGTVDSAKIVMDRDTGRSKGFGFVEMSSGDEAAAAIEKLNGQDMGGRSLVVNEARPMEPRTGGGGGGRGGFGGGGGGRGGDRGGFGGGRGGDRGGDRGGNRW
jgi:cold-inducible RNA-binding protein